MANYELYQSDGVTPIAIPQPNISNWGQARLGTFANSAPRFSKYRTVVWLFNRMSETKYQVFKANRPADGRMTFKTWIEESNSYAKCTGVMDSVKGGKSDGERLGVTVKWTSVEVV